MKQISQIGIGIMTINWIFEDMTEIKKVYRTSWLTSWCKWMDSMTTQHWSRDEYFFGILQSYVSKNNFFANEK